MQITELIPFLESIGTTPKKGLSQNFLIDNNITKKILQTADVNDKDVVLEIGPGPGALTKLLLEKKARVFAIEKDPILAKALLRLQTPDLLLNVICDDALEINFLKIPFNKVVANLPYHITTPLLEKCFQCPFETLTIMVQKEVADRLFAKHNTKDFGSLSLFAQFYCHLDHFFVVSPNCFYPKPSVDSAVIHLKKKKQNHEHLAPYFFPLMRKAFQQRRKMLSTSLQSFAKSSDIKELLSSLNLREDSRPEMLSFDNWISFTEKFASSTNMKP